MKSMPLKSGAILCIAVLLTGVIYAQRPQRRATQTIISKQKPATIPVASGIPIIIDSSALVDTIEAKSIKPPGSFGLRTPGNRIPLPYENLRWDDALYVQKVWRELDLREKINLPFLYDAIDDNGSRLFINILLKAVRTGQVQAFADERFTTPVTKTRIDELTRGKLDTIPRYNPTTAAIDAWIVTRADFDPKTVTKLLMMEEWVFDRESGQIHCRIIGIAPLKTRYIPNAGKQTEASSIMFWVNYPDLRPVLANAEVYNPKNMGQNRMTWEELFESRMFSSYIVKSTLDNATNRPIRSYIKDPILALVEGENIKNKIFNYEQDLWSY